MPYQAVAPVGNLSPIMDEPEFDMDIGIHFSTVCLKTNCTILCSGDISLPSLDDSDIESDASLSSVHNVQLHDALRLAYAVTPATTLNLHVC